MIRAYIYVFGFIWVVVSFCSLVLGPFSGFDRAKVRRELNEFHAADKPSLCAMIIRHVIFGLAYFGFLFPAIRPFIGICVGLLLIAMGVAI
jgi:uncharacterized membrane protein